MQLNKACSKKTSGNINISVLLNHAHLPIAMQGKKEGCDDAEWIIISGTCTCTRPPDCAESAKLQ